MGVNMVPTTGCNLSCGYCYQNDERNEREQWVQAEYDLDEMKERLLDMKERYPDLVPGLHGGESLLIPKEDIREIYEFIWEHYGDRIEAGVGRPGIQTNGTLLDEEHIEIFEEYDVSVGISCDGPWPLNEYRVPYGQDEEQAKRTTERTLEAIEMLVESGVGCGLIVVLNQANAGTDERLEKLLEWQTDLCKNKGVTGHWNPGIPYRGQAEKSLSPERHEEVLLRGWEWVKEEQIRYWNPMREYVDNLLGASLNNCINSKCDPYNAGAARFVTDDGETSGCGKTWNSTGDGPAFLQGPSTGNEYEENLERYDVLKKLPGPYTEGDAPDMGGCRGCKYWNICQGGCPAAGGQDRYEEGEYRHRTLWCEAVYALYERIERDLRAMFPNITLVTDYPWNVEFADLADSRRLDIAPFAAMDPAESGKSSTYSYGAEHDRGGLWDRVPEEAYPEMGYEELVEFWEKQVGPENVSGDPETGKVHADESQSGGWERGDDA